jgi:hypothetical protein
VASSSVRRAMWWAGATRTATALKQQGNRTVLRLRQRRKKQPHQLEPTRIEERQETWHHCLMPLKPSCSVAPRQQQQRARRRQRLWAVAAAATRGAEGAAAVRRLHCHPKRVHSTAAAVVVSHHFPACAPVEEAAP